MGKLQKHINPSDNDLLYIIDVDGGLGGRPKTKVIDYSSLKANNTPGVNGESAYQIAVRLGFQGTEQQWINSLKGESFVPSNLTATTNLTVNANSNNQVQLNLGNTFLLSKVATNIGNTRVRLYLNQAFANADINRAIGASLPTSHGLIYDAVFTGLLSLDVLPCAIASPQADCILVVNNLSSSQQNISLTFDYIKLR